MKIKGRTIAGPNVELIVIPRGDRESVVLKAKAVVDYDAFDALVPVPVPPMITHRGEKVAVPNFEDPDYRKASRERFTKRANWIMLESLSATEGLEWDTIRMNEPSTWTNIDSELKTAGFSKAEVNMISNAVSVANGLDDEKIKEARDRFLSGESSKVSPQ